MEKRQLHSWASAILDLPSTFLRNIHSGMMNERQCLVLYSLSDYMAHYAKDWWVDVFYDETMSNSAAAVGMELAKALTKGLELIQLYAQKRFPAVVWSILSGVAQFHEIVEDARRYSQMLNRLIQVNLSSSSQNPGKKQQVAQQLRHKVEFDCRVLQTKLVWAYEQDKVILLQTLKRQESSGILPNILRSFWGERSVFHDRITSSLISILEIGLPLNIDSRDLYPREYLGNGAFGRVSKTQWCELPVAIKEFLCEPHFLREFNVFRKFLAMGYSSHIVGIIGCSESKSIVLELMDKDLIRLIEERRTADSSPFLLDDSIDIMLQIAEGMRHLHHVDVAYRDLKPTNVLIKIREDQSFLVKLADFGVSKHNFGTAYENSSNTGTRIYMAPEMMKEGGNYSRKVDVHSYGMVCFEILTGKQPYLAPELVKAGKRPVLPKDIPISLDKLIQRCWNEDANARPSFEEICDELWLIKEKLLLQELTKEADPAAEITELRLSMRGLSCLKVECASTVQAEAMHSNDHARIGRNVVIDGHGMLDTIYSNQPFPPLSAPLYLEGEEEEGEGEEKMISSPGDEEIISREEEIKSNPGSDPAANPSIKTSCPGDEENISKEEEIVSNPGSDPAANPNIQISCSGDEEIIGKEVKIIGNPDSDPAANPSIKISCPGDEETVSGEEETISYPGSGDLDSDQAALSSIKSSRSNLGLGTMQSSPNATSTFNTSSQTARHGNSRAQRFLNWLKSRRLGKKQDTEKLKKIDKREAEEAEDWKEKLKKIGTKELKYSALKTATKDFSDKQLLGQGAFGRVYRGHMAGHIDVAVKVLKEVSPGGERRFMAELLVIGCVRHKNLVELRGWCQERDKLILVYDYMENGSLDEHLFRKDKFLSWSQRYKILTGVAEGLEYLHSGQEQTILHRDIKAANVLLDAQMVAHLGDFGLAKLTDDNDQKEMARTTTIKGTAGYIAPEYSLTGMATSKSDIYSFGILLLEVACGRPAIMRHHDDRRFIFIVDYVSKAHLSGNLHEVVDPRLGSEYNKDEALCVLTLGFVCSTYDPTDRPDTKMILKILNRGTCT